MGKKIQKSHSFKDATTPSEIKDYLMRVLSRTGGRKKESIYLYHYTNINSAANIIHEGFLWLGSTKKMNDYLEGEFIDSLGKRGRTFFASFSKSEENLAMYKMYTKVAEDGVMLSMSYSEAQRILNKLPAKEGRKQVYIVRNEKLTEETIDAEVYWSAVCYKDLHSDTLNADSVSNKNIEKPFTKTELVGFVKYYGWEYEKEVRLCVITDRALSENEKVAIKLPQDIEIQLITGPEFKIEKNRKAYSEIKREGTSIANSAYTGLINLGREASASAKNDNEAESPVLQRAKMELEIRANVILAYSNKLGGSIFKSQTKRSTNYIIGEKYPLKENNSNREEAKWEEVIDFLVDNGLIKSAETTTEKTDYKVTSRGYDVSDDFIEKNGIDVSQPPRVWIEALCKALPTEKPAKDLTSMRAEKALEWVTNIAKQCTQVSSLAENSLSPEDPRERDANFQHYIEEREELVRTFICEKAIHQEAFEKINHNSFESEIGRFIDTIDKVVGEYIHKPDTLEALDINNRAFQGLLRSVQSVQIDLTRIMNDP